MKAKCKCKGCFSDATCRDGMCGKHTTAERHKRNYSARNRPRTTAPHIGVEVECIASDYVVHRALLSQTSTPCHDGSLGAFGCEYKLCAPATHIVRKAARLVSHVREAGGSVDKRCGLHVHIDCRNVSTTRQLQVCDWLALQEEWMFSLMPKSRRDNVYCQRTINEGHYSWVNRTSQKTIEVRLHGGTLNPHKVSGWLSAMICISDWLRCDKTLPTPKFSMVPRYGETAYYADPTWLAEAYPLELASEYLLARQNAKGHLDYMEAVTETA